jgi:hypothetical protein
LFSAKHSPHSGMPSFSSQSPISCTAAHPPTHLAVFRAKISDLRPDVNSPRHCACMCVRPRAGMPACIRYRLGKAVRSASSCAKPTKVTVAVQTSLLSCRKAGKARICASSYLGNLGFTHAMKTLLAGLILIHSWYPNECCADKDCHPVPCDEISGGENGAMHWKNLIFEGTQIRTSPDSECHVCHLLHEGRPVIPICIFTQKKPSA